MKLFQLFSWKGEVSRITYITWGIVLFAIKYNLDRLIAFSYDRTWYFTDYFVHSDQLALQELDSDAKKFYLFLLLNSLPFIWFGIVLCLKRLRNAKLPAWTVIFFFIPFINIFLFILLSAIPGREQSGDSPNKMLVRVIPQSKYGSAIFSVGIVLAVSLPLVIFLLKFLSDYGWSLFAGVPFFLGFGSVLIYGHHKKLRYSDALGVAFTSVLFFNLFIFILAFEGIICLAMAFPIVIFLAWVGACIGYAIHDNHRSSGSQLFLLPVFLIPLSGVIEHQVQFIPPTYALKTEITINASRYEVWNQLVAFGKIDEPADWFFKTGIAYPTDAEIDGKGAGAIRKCNFTTGPFIEPITVWDEPNILAFGVLDQPPPMVEWSVYENLEIAHLNGYFKSVKGQFTLEELPGGQTKLTGTTWYRHDIWPSSYWKLWSDYILHRIHFRVLEHIKKKAEA